MKKLTNDEIAYFCEQLALMLESGMNLSDGLSIICEDISDKKISSVCEIMLTALNDGNTLAGSMEKSGAFPEYSVKMVKIGEVSGQLEKVLNGLNEYYSDRAQIGRAIRTALLHPLLLLGMMTAVIIVLITLVIPMFGEIFEQFDASVTAVVQQSIDMAYAVGTVMLIVLLVILAISLVVGTLSVSPKFRKALSGFVARFPLTRKMARKFTLSKLAGAFNIMVTAGLSPDEMLEYSAELVDDKALSQKLRSCREKVIDGEYFADVISKAGIFPAMQARGLKLSYSSGSFEKAWKKLSDHCGEEAMESAEGLVSFVEPAIVIVLTTVIGAILLTVMLPLMNIMSVMG